MPFQASQLACTLVIVITNGEKLIVPETKSFRVLSSIRDDVWHSEKKAGAYEWWYFDAVSDDGRETLVVIFLDGFIFSPRYNRAVKEYLDGSRRRVYGGNAPKPGDFPAVAVSLYRDGRLVWRAINEYEPTDFVTQMERPACRIGSNSFELDTASGENIYRVQLDCSLRGKRKLQAALAWVIEEGDFASSDKAGARVDVTSAHEWNLVAPRCRVKGTINVIEQNGVRVEREWTGTGYHDHNLDARWMPATIAEWQWGRAHFADATAIFYRYREQENEYVTTRLYIVRGGELKMYEPQLVASKWRRHFFGLRYSRAIEMRADSGKGAQLSLRIEQRSIVDSSFFYLRFTGEAELDLDDGVVRRAVAITEQLAPRALQWRGLWWLTSLRIGRAGRTSFLP